MKSKHLMIIIPIFTIFLFVSLAQAADPIRIGWTADMPGIAATFYESQKRAAELFIENKKKLFECIFRYIIKRSFKRESKILKKG